MNEPSEHVYRPDGSSAEALRPDSMNSTYAALAPGIRLHGQMPGVGFTTSQWLIERNQQFLQVSELLYRVAEQIDGTRSPADIAARVTEASDWVLGPEHVEHLVEKKLRPLGLVTSPDGQAQPRPVSADRGSSPLRLQMRMRMMPPRFVEALTDVLQYAYAPALFIPIAALIAWTHWWMYFVSGVERGVASSLYQPGALGAVLAIAIIAGLFHELGHSSALKYGGGHPRGIGFGLYLMFPAFYSDVTDSYRLGRWARIRTDLGGIYFHLIFAAALIGVSAATGNEFVVAAAILFNIEAVRQFIPFVRLDGYWLLADLTGVPDFMSQIGSFARSVRRGRRYATALPQFKPWVTVVFGLYLVLSIPAIVYIIALMVMYLPELVALTRQALLVQTDLWAAPQQPLSRVLIGLQIALIPLPLAAAVYFLYLTFSSVAAQIATRRGWKAPAFPVRRVAGASALAAAVAFVAIAWPSAAAKGGRHNVDPALLMQRVTGATARVQSLEADLTGALGEETISGTIALSRPNRAHIQVHGAADSLGTFTVISDGAKLFVFFPEDKHYTEVKVAADGANINAFIVDQVRTFFKPDRLAPQTGQHLTYIGREQVGTRAYEVLEVRGSGTDGPSWRYYISPEDNLPHRVAVTTFRDGKTSTRVMHLENIRLNGNLDQEQFRWTPPSDGTSLGFGILGGKLPLNGPPN